MAFPKTIYIFTQQLTLCDEKKHFSGLNAKQFYEDENGDKYIAKTDKERKFEDIFKGIMNITKDNKDKYKKHLDELRDAAMTTSLIALNIAKRLFPELRVPENYLCRLEDGTPVILSKLISKDEHFQEFVSNSTPVLLTKPQKPGDWQTLPKRSSFDLTKEQMKILGKLYYIALFLGHLDILNNINLTNSGSITLPNGELRPCIVDWGNCLGIGFGGVSQDSTAFNNPEFVGLNLTTGMDPVTGFTGCVPFDKIVYPKLPRRVVSDLFNITDRSEPALLIGFKEAHCELKRNFSKQLINNSIMDSLHSAVPQEQVVSFIRTLNQELFIGDNKKNKEPILGSILEGRLNSLDDIITKIDQGHTLDNLSQIQLDKIISSQSISAKEEKNNLCRYC